MVCFPVAGQQECRHSCRLCGSSSVCCEGPQSAANCVVSCLAKNNAKRFESLGKRAEGVLKVPCEQHVPELHLKCLCWEAAPQRLRLHAALLGTLHARFTQPQKEQVHPVAKGIYFCFFGGTCGQEWLTAPSGLAATRRLLAVVDVTGWLARYLAKQRCANERNIKDLWVGCRYALGCLCGGRVLFVECDLFDLFVRHVRVLACPAACRWKQGDFLSFVFRD